MVINNLDFGVHSTWLLPLATNAGSEFNQNVSTQLIEGTKELGYLSGVQLVTRTEDIYLTASNAIGGQAAGSQQAAQYLFNQLMELTHNPNLQPCYIQWKSGGGIVATDPDDGWYFIQKVKPDNEFVWTGIVKVTLTAVKVAPPSPSRVGVSYSGATLSTNYTGTGTNWVSFPVSSTNLVGSLTRTGAEGSIPWAQLLSSPGFLAENPAPVVLSSTISNVFLGGCKVFDVTAAIATNPVPTNGTFVHANWIEVLATNHRFIGDIVITNGLLLITFSPNSSSGVIVYLWNTALASAAWQQVYSHFYTDSTGANLGTLRHLSFLRIGQEEIACRILSTAAANSTSAEMTFRLQRGTYHCRVDFRPLSENAPPLNNMFLRFPSSVKISFGSAIASDTALDFGIGNTTDYGYGAAFINSATYPFIGGWLFQNTPFQSPVIVNSLTDLIVDTGTAQNNINTFALFAFPFGTQTTTTDKLQAEAESGTLSGGVVTNANGSASGVSEAKVPSGTGAQIPAPVPLSGMTDTGAGAGTLNKGGYTVVQTWTDASGETTSSGDSTSFLTITNQQIGAMAETNGTSIAPTLTSSTAGKCLVAVLGSDGPTFSAPANWVLANSQTAVGGFSTARIEIWYYPNNPGGITSATFTTTSTANMRAEISEWSNVALVSSPDGSPVNDSQYSGTTVNVSVLGLGKTAGDVAIAAWTQIIGSITSVSFITPSGFTRLTDDGATATSVHTNAEYKIYTGIGGANTTLACTATTQTAAGCEILLKPATANTVFLTTNGDKLHVPLITGAPATTTNGKFYFTAVPAGINAGLAATQAVAASQIAAFDITVNPGAVTSPPAANTTAGTPGIDLFGTSFIPPAGTYNLWFRVKVTSAAGTTQELRFGLWDVTSGLYVASTLWKPNQVTTGYAWYLVASNVTPTAGHNMQYRLNTNAGTGTNWFIDEAAFVPTSTSTFNFPQDMWQQFIFDRTTKLVLD